jgi:hypothetical protein
MIGLENVAGFLFGATIVLLTASVRLSKRRETLKVAVALLIAAYLCAGVSGVILAESFLR